MTITERLPYTNEGRLTLRTGGSWTAAELRELLAAVEIVYGVFLSLDFLETVVEDLADPRRSAIDYLDTSLLTLLTGGWPSLAAARAAIYSERYYYAFDLEREERNFLKLLERSAYRWHPAGVLRIARVRMESPGLISFAGLGEPLRQVRELIKDLWYRNSQERERGELEIEAIRLFLRSAKKATKLRNPDSLDRSVLFLADGVRRLRNLEQDDHLRDIGKDAHAEEDPAA